TWFWEAFVLKQFEPAYEEFNSHYNFVFNSYYETAGARVIRTDRGNLSRPSVSEIYKYREHVDRAMEKFLNQNLNDELSSLILLGLNHEEQHQELLCTDIKYILGNNPLFPALTSEQKIKPALRKNEWIKIPAGVYEIGYSGDGFCFDNEIKRHKVFLDDYAICNALVTNGEYLEF